MGIIATTFDRVMVKLGRRRLVLDDRDPRPLFARYYILFNGNLKGEEENQDFSKSKPINAFVHNLIRSDLDSFHDHGWDNWRFVLCGGYWEHTPWAAPKWIGRFSFKRYKAEELHWIEVPEGMNTWTLFIHFKRRRDWGFIDKNGSWVDHKTYIHNREVEAKRIAGLVAAKKEMVKKAQEKAKDVFREKARRVYAGSRDDQSN